ncbi:MAG: hypothetical protein IKU90_03390 [Clostridia bacterium]|nr:hypothetical protein [Clostridia bacterium]
MKGKNAFEAMEGIDHKYILEAAPDAVPLRVENRPHRIRVAAVVATVSALAVTAVCLGVGVMKQSGDAPPVIPPITGTQDAELPTDGENTSTEGNTLPADSGEEETAAPLNGSYTTDLYTVTEIDGKYYLNFFEENHPLETETGVGSSSIMILPSLTFPSVECMQQKFLTGDWTEDEIKTLKRIMYWKGSGFEMPDVDHLYEAVVPDGWGGADKVWYHGDWYSFSIKNEATYRMTNEGGKGETGYIGVYPREKFDIRYQRDFVDFMESHKNDLLDGQNEYDGYPCRIYEYDTSVATLRSVILTIEEKEYSYNIQLTYLLAHDDKSQQDRVNPDAPYSVNIYGNRYGQGFYVYLSSLEQSPTVDYLLSFGIQPLSVVTETDSVAESEPSA